MRHIKLACQSHKCKGLPYFKRERLEVVKNLAGRYICYIYFHCHCIYAARVRPFSTFVFLHPTQTTYYYNPAADCWVEQYALWVSRSTYTRLFTPRRLHCTGKRTEEKCNLWKSHKRPIKQFPRHFIFIKFLKRAHTKGVFARSPWLVHQRIWRCWHFYMRSCIVCRLCLATGHAGAFKCQVALNLLLEFYCREWIARLCICIYTLERAAADDENKSCDAILHSVWERGGSCQTQCGPKLNIPLTLGEVLRWIMTTSVYTLCIRWPSARC